MTEALAGVLLGPRRAQERLDRAQRRRWAKLSEVLRITPGYRESGGGGGGAGGPKDSQLAVLADMSLQVRELRRQCEEAENTLERFLEKLEREFPDYGARDAVLLRCRYRDGRSWAETRSALASRGYWAKTERTLYNWHRGALDRGEALVMGETENGEHGAWGKIDKGE